MATRQEGDPARNPEGETEQSWGAGDGAAEDAERAQARIIRAPSRTTTSNSSKATTSNSSGRWRAASSRHGTAGRIVAGPGAGGRSDG